MVKTLKDENAPKRPLTAYFAWQNSIRAKVTKSMPDAGVADLAKEFGKRWKAMSDGQKAPFVNKQKGEQEKYHKKMTKYKTTPQWAKFQKLKAQNKLDNVKSSKFKKDENAPTRPQSAFFLFMADERGDLIADGMAHKDAAKKLGNMWSALSAGKKKPYEDKAATLKAKYDKVLEKYKKSSNYKKYHAEKDEFMANRKAELKKLTLQKEPSKSRSKSAKRSASKKRAAKRSRSRSKSTKRKVKKAKRSRSRSKKRARSRSKSKKRSRN